MSSCVFVWCCVVWCVWHAENPVCRLKTLSVCRFKTSPCVRAPRPWAWCRYTRRSSPVLLTKNSPRMVITWPQRSSPKVTTGCCPYSSLRKDREQHVSDSSNHSLCLIKLLSNSYCGETLEGTSREMVRFVFRSHEKKYNERFAR